MLVANKDLSYFINKHVRDGSLDASTLQQITDILNYDVVAYASADKENQIFLKKAIGREGYIEAIIKQNGDEEEIFHFLYRDVKHANKYFNKLIKEGLIIDNKLR